MTVLSEHKFPYQSFIGGWYIPTQTCDNLISHFENNKHNSKRGLLYRDHKNQIDTEVKDSNDLICKFYDNNIKADILAKMNNHTFINSLSGHHCIGVGLRYFGVDILKDTASEENNFTLDLRNKEVNKWNIQCKFKPKLIQFLKDNIHF